MPASLPNVTQLRKAVEIFLHHAYCGGDIPPSVCQKTLPFSTLPGDAPAETSWFETAVQNGRKSYLLRLGHRGYPHMKLVLEESPDQREYLYRADAHDRHLHAPEGSVDSAALEQLRRVNHHLVEDIEHAWTQADIPTFREYLRLAVQRAKAETTR